MQSDTDFLALLDSEILRVRGKAMLQDRYALAYRYYIDAQMQPGSDADAYMRHLTLCESYCRELEDIAKKYQALL